MHNMASSFMHAHTHYKFLLELTILLVWDIRHAFTYVTNFYGAYSTTESHLRPSEYAWVLHFCNSPVVAHYSHPYVFTCSINYTCVT